MNTSTTHRSHCGVSCALDILGDKWSLLIVRDIVFLHKKTFKDFVASHEHIATNILADRLKKLEANGILLKKKAPHNHKVNYYSLTEKGVALLPILLELISWSHDHLDNTFGKKTRELYSSFQKDKKKTEKKIRKQYVNQAS